MAALLQEKKNRLRRHLQTFDRLAVALSGGVDSALLLAEAHAVLGRWVIAVTARSPIHPDQDVDDAATIAAGLGVPHFIVDSGEMGRADFLANTPERCYICKKNVFGHLLTLIREKGFKHLAHGANADDRGDYRPGMRAARELGVAAPLMDAGLTKDDIRRMAKDRGLFVWDKPAMACLATRFPYGTPLDAGKIEMVRYAEQVLAGIGLVGCRVRHHGAVARIEVPLDRLPALVADPLRGRIIEQFRKIGFLHITVDLEGYVPGSMNRVLDNDDHGHITPNS
ncbi:ATP-dependent sacrificial sulfur transferase LarE [uncultured Desulfosarcina sp.]|uniref:ATP-dependent sacrificial sulfur transferase LarE n=1 Tax=uncultured Desulfosarcina sp. TaxID=218289 RepID=UPI0029C76758|nr:ATP-dependent sacrificial sulfur transferase LarE [uncultured Desulfosarcina sp.]